MCIRDSLGGFLFQHVDHVIDGDDADQHALSVDNRQRGQVIALSLIHI